MEGQRNIKKYFKNISRTEEHESRWMSPLYVQHHESKVFCIKTHHLKISKYQESSTSFKKRKNKSHTKDQESELFQTSQLYYSELKKQ